MRPLPERLRKENPDAKDRVLSRLRRVIQAACGFLAGKTGFASMKGFKEKTGSLPVSPRGEGFSKGVTRAFISV
jgi:hypothetical protein